MSDPTRKPAPVRTRDFDIPVSPQNSVTPPRRSAPETSPAPPRLAGRSGAGAGAGRTKSSRREDRVKKGGGPAAQFSRLATASVICAVMNGFCTSRLSGTPFVRHSCALSPVT